MYEVSSVREQQVLESEPTVEYYNGVIEYGFEEEFLPEGLPRQITFKVVEVDGVVEDIIDTDF